MKIRIEIDEAALKRIIMKELRDSLGDVRLDEKKVQIEVKSKQNYKSEWDPAAFRAIYEDDT